VAYPRQHESSSNCTFQLQIRCTEWGVTLLISQNVHTAV
jgi:hypothetical protein